MGTRGMNASARPGGGWRRRRARLLAVAVLLAVLSGVLVGTLVRRAELETVVGVDLVESPEPAQRLQGALQRAREEHARMLLVGVVQPTEQLLNFAAPTPDSDATPPRTSRAPNSDRDGKGPDAPPQTDLPQLTVALVGGADGLRPVLDALPGSEEQLGDGILVVRDRRDRFNQPLALLAALLVLGGALAINRGRLGAPPPGQSTLPDGPLGADPFAADPDPHSSTPRYAPGSAAPPAIPPAAVPRPRRGPVEPRPAPPPGPRRPADHRAITDVPRWEAHGASIGTVRTPLAAGGYVEVDGVLLWAQADHRPVQPYPPGTPVQVVPDRSGGYLARPLASVPSATATPPLRHDTRERGPY